VDDRSAARPSDEKDVIRIKQAVRRGALSDGEARQNPPPFGNPTKSPSIIRMAATRALVAISYLGRALPQPRTVFTGRVRF
jgi:hypothetical protein